VFLEGLIQRGSLPVLQQVISFTEARHEVLANNISNLDTVGYKIQDLPAEEFNAALRRAVDRRARRGAGAPLEMTSTDHLSWNERGSLQYRLAEVTDNNILFHDRNNRFVEKQMADVTQNALRHKLASELLKQQYGLLKMAISGRIA